MSRKKNVYNQAKRGVKRYKKAKARKKGRAAIFAVVAMILAAVGVSQKNIGQLEQAVDNILDAYETTVDAETSQAVGDGGNAEVPAGSAAPDDAISESPDSETPEADGSGQAASGDSSDFATVPSGTEIGAGAEVYVDLAAIPAYSGEPYAIVNGNMPYFTASDLTSESFEYYSDLDNLGRCGTAYASVGTDLMPTEKRGSISKVKPSGWQISKYDFVDGKYLYNRCHLIGFQLTGENANDHNLITGTRYLNTEGMLPFEDQVAEYVKTTDHHVIYRVTPDFHGSELVARGVEMEAASVEDDAIRFHVYCYNVQPGVAIDYATGESWLSDGASQSETAENTEQADESYVLNTRNKKFHLPTCSSVADMSESNREDYAGSREKLIQEGYSPCGRCKP